MYQNIVLFCSIITICLLIISILLIGYLLKGHSTKKNEAVKATIEIKFESTASKDDKSTQTPLRIYSRATKEPAAVWHNKSSYGNGCEMEADKPKSKLDILDERVLKIFKKSIV